MESVIPRAESWLLGEQFDEAVATPKFDLHPWEHDRGGNLSPTLSHTLPGPVQSTASLREDSPLHLIAVTGEISEQ